MRTYLKEEMLNMPRRKPEDGNTDVGDVLAVARAQDKSRKVCSGKEAVALLLNRYTTPSPPLQSPTQPPYSQRVFKDLNKALVTEHIYEMKIAIREWSNINPEWEFRGTLLCCCGSRDESGVRTRGRVR